VIDVEYTVIDGRSHKWDDLGEAATTLIYHYRRLIMRLFGKSYCQHG
jgi:hypothetical protein